MNLKKRKKVKEEELQDEKLGLYNEEMQQEEI